MFAYMHLFKTNDNQKKDVAFRYLLNPIKGYKKVDIY